MRNYDVVVVGAGVFGAWIALHLKRTGRTVALVDAYGPANARASSGGESRIIRASYGADEIYARWAARSLSMWKDFFIQVNEPLLFHPTGVLWTTHAGDPRLAANRTSLEHSGVRFEALSQASIEQRYPQIRFSWPVDGVFEPDGGVILARRAVQAVVREALRLGVEWFSGIAEPPARSGRASSITIGAGVELTADNFIYACGPWFEKLPGPVKTHIHATRQEVFFFGTPPASIAFNSPSLAVWLDYSDPRGGYAVPNIEARGFKLAFDQHGPAFDPDTGDRVVPSHSVDDARAFLRERFPALAAAPLLEARVCQYENTSNGDFLIDRYPGFDNVWVAGGGSGHGFKHGPAVGEYVSGLLNGSLPAEPRFSFESKSLARARSVY